MIRDYLGRAEALTRGRNVKLYPFTLFHRSQPKSRTEWKDRVVWGSDHAETFAGLTVAKPAVESLRFIPGFEAWNGIEAVEARAAQIFAGGGFYVSTDFSGFDRSVRPTVLRAAFLVLESLFEPRLPERFWIQMYEYYLRGEIVTPEGILQGYHGLPSGVTWTNLVDTIIQLLILVQTLTILGKDLEQVDFMFLGDDGVISFRNEEEAKTHYRVCELYGLEVNEEKSDESYERFSFLQRHFRRELTTPGFCPGVYSGLRTIGRLIWTERGGFKIDDEVLTDSYVKYDAGFWVLVAFMKLENCKRHPKFREIVEIAVRGDRYGLNPDLIGVS